MNATAGGPVVQGGTPHRGRMSRGPRKRDSARGTTGRGESEAGTPDAGGRGVSDTDSRRAVARGGARMERVSTRAWSRHRTIGSAVRAAKEGGIIAVAAGVYHEHLVIDKSVTVLADGDDGTVELVATEGPAVEVRAGFMTVRGLTLRGGGPDGVSVAVHGGRLDLEVVVVSGGSVEVRGGGVVRLTGCRVHGTAGAAVHAAGGSQVEATGLVLEEI